MGVILGTQDSGHGMALAPKSIRQRIAAAIDSALGSASPPWSESIYAFPAFPAGIGDSRALVHLSYAVGIGDTESVSSDRQVPGLGAYSATQILVRYTCRLRADAHLADYDSAQDAETALISAVMATAQDPGLSIVLERTLRPRNPLGDGTIYLAQIDFRIHHHRSTTG